MLSLGRNPEEYIVIGNDIIIQVVSVGGMLRLAVEAPKEVEIIRGEIYEQSHPIPACIRKSRDGKQRKSDTA